MTVFNYVYLSYEEGGRKYIGSRTCYDCTPEEDPYLGSYSDKSFHPTKKEILAVCETRREANLIEELLHLHFEVFYDDTYANKAVACVCFSSPRKIKLPFDKCPYKCPLRIKINNSTIKEKRS